MHGSPPWLLCICCGSSKIVAETYPGKQLTNPFRSCAPLSWVIAESMNSNVTDCSSVSDLFSATKHFKKGDFKFYELKKVETFLKLRIVIEHGVLNECDKLCR